MLTQIANAAIAAYQAELRQGVELPKPFDRQYDEIDKEEFGIYGEGQLLFYGDARDAAAEQRGYLRGLEAGFDAGFIASARDWAERDDLLADMESPAYLRDRAAAIDKLKGGE